jgi:hypothetical protein
LVPVFFAPVGKKAQLGLVAPITERGSEPVGGGDVTHAEPLEHHLKSSGGDRPPGLLAREDEIVETPLVQSLQDCQGAAAERDDMLTPLPLLS